MKIRPILINIDKSIWLEFCKNVPETRTKNGTIIELIKKYNEGFKNDKGIFIPKK